MATTLEISTVYEKLSISIPLDDAIAEDGKGKQFTYNVRQNTYYVMHNGRVITSGTHSKDMLAAYNVL